MGHDGLVDFKDGGSGGVALSRRAPGVVKRCGIGIARAHAWVLVMCRKARDEKGQGTTEYAILVGVLVVIAIIAVTAFRGKIQELWTAIADGVNSL